MSSSSRFPRYFENPNCDDGPVNISPELIKARTMTCLDHILNNLQPTSRNCDGGKGLLNIFHTVHHKLHKFDSYSIITNLNE